MTTELGDKVALLNPLAPGVIENLHAIADAIVKGFSEAKRLDLNPIPVIPLKRYLQSRKPTPR